MLEYIFSHVNLKRTNVKYLKKEKRFKHTLETSVDKQYTNIFFWIRYMIEYHLCDWENVVDRGCGSNYVHAWSDVKIMLPSHTLHWNSLLCHTLMKMVSRGISLCLAYVAWSSCFTLLHNKADPESNIYIYIYILRIGMLKMVSLNCRSKSGRWKNLPHQKKITFLKNSKGSNFLSNLPLHNNLRMELCRRKISLVYFHSQRPNT